MFLGKIVLLLFTIIKAIKTQKSPIFVYQHFRHGHRGPIFNLNSEGIDLFRQKWTFTSDWSPIGMRQHYLLGYNNHLRYKDFLSPSFNPSELWIFSSNFNRTIQSALSNLQGLYPSSTGTVIEENQKDRAMPLISEISQEWQKEIDNLKYYSLPNQISVIPVHTFHISEHKFLLHEAADWSDCKPIKGIREKAANENKSMKSFINDFNEKYSSKLSNYLNFSTEEEKGQLRNSTYLLFLCDQYTSDFFANRDWLFWKEYGIDPDEFQIDCTAFLTKIIVNIDFDSNEVVMMSNSPTLRDMLHYMNNKIIDDKFKNSTDLRFDDYSRPKMWMISGHDVSVGGWMIFMKKVFDLGTEIVNPGFAFSVYFEVYKEKDEYLVKYKINDKEEISISYDEFKNHIEDALWSEENINNFCKFDDKVLVKDKEMYFILSMIFGLVSLILLTTNIISLVYICKNKFRKTGISTTDSSPLIVADN